MKFWVRIVVSILLILLIAIQLDWQKTILLLKGCHGGWLLLTFGILTAGEFLRPWRWQMLLRPLNIQIPFWTLVRWYFIGNLSSHVMPTGLGGDVVRISLMARSDGQVSEAVVSVLIERAVGLVALLVVAFWGAWYIPIPETLRFLLPTYLLILLCTAVIGVGTVLLGRSVTGRDLPRSGRLGKWWAKFLRMSVHCAAYVRHIQMMIIIFVISVLHQIMVVAGFYLAAKTLGIQIPWPVCLLSVPLATLATMLPISISGLGIRESVFVYLLAGWSIPREEAFVSGFALTLFVLIRNLVGGLIALSLEKKGASAHNSYPKK